MYKVLALIITLPFFWIYERQRPFSERAYSSTYENLVLGIFNFSFVFVCAFVLSSIWPPMESLNYSVMIFLFTILFLDAYTYVWHRLCHTFSFLWRFHKVHHSDMTLESTSAFRFHFVEVGLSFLFRAIIVRGLGLPLQAVVVYEVIFQFMNVLQHSNFSFPSNVDRFLCHLFITPALHRKHHDVTAIHQLKNYSTVLSLWDKVFLTYSGNDNDLIKTFGLENQMERWSVRKLFFFPFK